MSTRIIFLLAWVLSLPIRMCVYMPCIVFTVGCNCVRFIVTGRAIFSDDPPQYLFKIMAWPFKPAPPRIG